jgi:hypothetical protein
VMLSQDGYRWLACAATQVEHDTARP